MGLSIKFDYRFDESGFFDDPAHRKALERAAETWSNILNDNFATIPAGQTFTVANPLNFDRRETVTFDEPIDDIVVFVGAKDLSNALAFGGPSGFAPGDVIRSRVADEFRGQTVTDHEPFAGSIVFDSNADWSFTENPQANRIDFQSTAMHELAHVFGFGVSGAFARFVQGDQFFGPNAMAVNGGPIPLEGDGDFHIQEGFRDDMVLMDVAATRGTRVNPSELDKAILADIGYEIDGFQKVGADLPIATNSGELIFGTTVDDVLSGLGGDDQIQGNAGNDILIGGPGSDLLFGQEGVDTFVLEPGSNSSWALDFDLANEKILLRDSGFGNIEEVLASITKPFSNVSRITLSDGSYMDVSHEAQSGTPLTANNFKFDASEPVKPVVTSGNDSIRLQGGNETINTSDGFDTVIAGMHSSDATLKVISGNTVILEDRAGDGGFDRISNAERLVFEDRTIDLTDFRSVMTLPEDDFRDLAEMYVAYFNRAPDAEGLNYWAEQMSNGMSLSRIAEFFFDQNETRALYGSSSSTKAFVEAVYDNVLGRTPDGSGFTFWQNAINSGEVTRGKFVLEIIKGAKSPGGGNGDAEYLAMKADLGLYYSTILGMSNVSDARDVMEEFGSQAQSDLMAGIQEVEQHYAQASRDTNGDFLVPLVGVADVDFNTGQSVNNTSQPNSGSLLGSLIDFI